MVLIDVKMIVMRNMIKYSNLLKCFGFFMFDWIGNMSLMFLKVKMVDLMVKVKVDGLNNWILGFMLCVRRVWVLKY